MLGTRWFRQLQRLDWVLLFAAFVLFSFGLSAIYSVELSRSGVEFALIRKQLTAFFIGLAGVLIAIRSNPLLLRSYGRGLYFFGLILLVLVLFFGRTVNGTTGWFVLLGFSFQPIEFMKVALIVQLARYFGEHARRRFGWKEIFGSGFLVALPVGLTMLQPDFGSAMLLVGIWGIMLFFAGLRIHHAAVMGAVGVIFAVFNWFFVFKDFQKERVLVFLDPARDPLETGYNIMQAKIAIGSGQIYGRGLGLGSQSQLRFLPESQTDFIFAVIAEELGFIGVSVVFLMFGLLLARMLRIAKLARDNFTSFLVLGIFASLFVQSAVNIGVNLAILPATGVALPFVSYGGSSLIVTLVMIGIVESVATRLDQGNQSGSAWYNETARYE